MSIATGGCLCDLLTKHYVFQWRTWQQFGQAWWLVPDYFGIQTSVNPGALFGMGAGYTSIFVGLSFIALSVITYIVLVRREPVHVWLLVSLGLVTGGILGNLYDRLGLWHTADTPIDAQYCVRDWILFQCKEIPLKIFNPWPNFNIADCLLVVGACMLAIYSLRNDFQPATSANSQPSTPS